MTNALYKENKTIVGVLDPYNDKEKLEKLVKKINVFSLELLPRITRAQSMDILISSKSYRYKAMGSLHILKKLYL